MVERKSRLYLNHLKKILMDIYETDKKIIVLDSRIKGKRLFNTIIHEIFHLIAHLSKIKFRTIGEEPMAIEIGNGFTKIFKQNPNYGHYSPKLLK